ncbi:MAG TPA: hypothetical protein VFH50_05455 [Acidimicrobiales bacterium]|nr:hypothetical protein [Acidimicrobiales bacterium]
MIQARKPLIVAMAVGLAAAGAGAGAFASFSAETTNSNNVFATGTLILSDTVGSGTTCFSYNGTNNSASCSASDQQLVASATLNKPGQTQYADVTLTGAGTIDASALKIYGPAVCSDGNGTDTHVTGTGSLCGNVQWFVEEDTDNTFSTPVSSGCLYGHANGNGCDFAGTYPLSTFFGSGAGGHVGSANALTLPGTLASGTSRYFRVGFNLPASADNTFQNRTASFALTWHADQ